MNPNRRDVLKSLGCLCAAPYLGYPQSRAERQRISFSTLGCPSWDWKTILRHASEWGYAAIEVRGIQGQMDLTKVPEFSGSRVPETLKEILDLNVRICNLGASARMHESSASARSAQLDEGKRFIDLARKLQCPYVRVFGDRYPPGEDKNAVLDRVVAGLGELGQHARGSGVQVILESHGDFTDSDTLLGLLQRVGMQEVALLWDAHHTFVAGNEQPVDTWKKLKAYIRHTHLKDSTGTGEDLRYVLVGKGRVPVRETVRILKEGGYRGFYGLEWEKAWHKEIEEPEVAFPHYAQVMRDYLG
jgi:sugar phosphate isomerase/epimerase